MRAGASTAAILLVVAVLLICCGSNVLFQAPVGLALMTGEGDADARVGRNAFHLDSEAELIDQHPHGLQAPKTLDIEELFDAIDKDQLYVLRSAIEQGFDPRYHQDKSGERVLFHAASVGAYECVKYLIEVEELPVDDRQEDGSTPFITASWHGHVEVAKYLASKGADVHTKCYNGWNAVMGAVYWDEISMLEYLLTIGVELDVPEKHGKFTPLKLAAAKGHVHVVEFLLAFGADPTHVDSDGRTPRSIAEKRGFTLIAERLRAAEEEFYEKHPEKRPSKEQQEEQDSHDAAAAAHSRSSTDNHAPRSSRHEEL